MGPLFDGVACEVDWPAPDLVTVAVGLYESPVRTDIVIPPPRPGGKWMPTSTALGLVNLDEPLWPHSESGRRLRRLYLDRGVRALCDPESLGWEPWWMPAWWDSF